MVSHVPFFVDIFGSRVCFQRIERVQRAKKDHLNPMHDSL
jgi:hypothetical protein